MRFNLTIGLLFVAAYAQGAVFCVSNSQELRQALNDAAVNLEDDEIRLKSGDYLTGSNNPFVLFQNEDYDLHISGGWADFNQLNCIVQSLDPFNTVLDGNGESRVLDIKLANGATSQLALERLTILGGRSVAVFSAGLNIDGPTGFVGRVLLERMAFVGNTGVSGAALDINGGFHVTIRNNVFSGNTTTSGWGVIGVQMTADQQGVYFVNNTVIHNHHDLATPGPFNNAGVQLAMSNTASETSIAYIANNLLWNNETADLYTATLGEFFLYNNNIGQRIGNVDHDAGNIAQDPQLSQQILNFTPQVQSPLVDAGRSMPNFIPIPTPFPLDWDHGNSDFDGFNRITNRRVDIGAVEAPLETPIFEDGFD